MAFSDFAKRHKGFLMIVGTIMAGGSIAYAVYRNNRNKVMIAKIEDIINKNIDYREAVGKAVASEVFQGSSYLTRLKSSGVVAYIMLKPTQVDKAAVDLYNAMYGGITGVGTDEDKINAVFDSLRDQVAVSQIYQAYKDKYKRNLTDDLMSELDQGRIYVLYDKVLAKPRYRKPA